MIENNNTKSAVQFFTVIMAALGFIYNIDLFLTCCAVFTIECLQYFGLCCCGRKKCFFYYVYFMLFINNNKIFRADTVWNGLFTLIGIFNTMFSGLLFVQSSIYHIKVGVDPEIRTITVQGSSNPIGSTVVTINPPTVDQRQPEAINQPGIAGQSTVIAVGDNNVVNGPTSVEENDIPSVNVDESDLWDMKKYIIYDLIFCGIFIIYTFAYSGFHDDGIQVLAIIFLICRIVYLVLICMRKWRTLIYQIVYVVNSIVSVGYFVILIWLIVQMVNFIKVASMNDADFILWLLDHREFIPKNPSSDYDPRKIVKANIYAYGITAFFFLSFLCESIFTVLAGYSYAFAPKSKPKEEENVVIPEVESIPQPEKEPENKNENNVTITPVENNPPNNPIVVQTTMAFGVIEDEKKKDDELPGDFITERDNNDENGDNNNYNPTVHL